MLHCTQSSDFGPSCVRTSTRLFSPSSASMSASLRLMWNSTLEFDLDLDAFWHTLLRRLAGELALKLNPTSFVGFATTTVGFRTKQSKGPTRITQEGAKGKILKMVIKSQYALHFPWLSFFAGKVTSTIGSSGWATWRSRETFNVLRSGFSIPGRHVREPA